MCAVLVFAALAFTLLSPLFHIRRVDIPDLTEEQRQTVLRLLGEPEGENGILYVTKHIKGLANVNFLFGMRAKSIEEEITFALPELKNVKVQFSFPDTLKVEFVKRFPAYLVDISGSYICADPEGFILSVHTDRSERDLPVVRGITLQDYKVGQSVASENKNQIQALKAIFNEIYKCDAEDDGFKLSSHIEIVDVSEYNKIWLFVNSNLSVNLGDLDNITYKIPALKEILQTEGMLDGKGQIDFTSSSSPVFKPEA